MSRELIEIMVLAAIALVVVARLYSVLGKRTGSERPTQQPAPRTAATAGDLKSVTTPTPAPAPRADLPPAATGGVADIAAADPSFEASDFLAGARAAYEMIVQAFAAGDRDTLRPLLSPRIFAPYEKAIADREASGGKGPELVRLKAAEIVDAELDGQLARIAVRFEAELAEGAHGLRDTREKWTFERDVTSRDPNWLLASVAQA